MGKTYNSKHDFLKKFDNYEFPNGYNGNGYHLEAGKVTDYDYSFTTHRSDNNAQIETTRHPNKHKKRGSLGREFTKTGMSGTRYWRNRFGEESDKSSRNRLVRREMSHTRRHRLKNDAEEIINNALNEE